MKLVTRDEAKAQVEATGMDDFDLLLDSQIEAASGLVINYMNGKRNIYAQEMDSNGDWVFDSNGRPAYELDSDGKKITRYEVKAAVLMLIGILFRDRDGEESEKWQQGYLPAPVTALLYNLRTPNIA